MLLKFDSCVLNDRIPRNQGHLEVDPTNEARDADCQMDLGWDSRSDRRSGSSVDRGSMAKSSAGGIASEADGNNSRG